MDRSSSDVVEMLRTWRNKMPANWYGSPKIDAAISEILALRGSLQTATPTTGEDKCDCQQPEEINGLRMISNSCPVHNDNPDPPAPRPDAPATATATASDAVTGEAKAEEDDETIARRLAIIFHGDDKEWRGFLTKAHHWMSLAIDTAALRSSDAAGTPTEWHRELVDREPDHGQYAERVATRQEFTPRGSK